MNLPVNPTQVDTSYFVGNLPNVCPPFPVNQVPPSIGQMGGLVLGLTALFIQQNAGANPARTFFSNLVSRNNWQNPEAANVAATVFEVVDFALATSGGNMNKQAVVEDAVGRTVQMMTAFYVMQYQEGVGPYLTPQLGQQLNALLEQFMALRNEVQRYYNQNQNMGGFGNGGYQTMGMQNVGYGGFSSQLGNMRRMGDVRNATSNATAGTWPTASPDSFNRPLSGRFGARDSTLVDTRDVQPTFRSYVGGGPGRPTEVVQTPGSVGRAVEELAPTQGVVTIGNRTFRSLDAAVPAPQPTPAPAPQAPAEFQVADPTDPYREITWPDGTVLRPAVVSGWQRSRTSKNPYPIAYNPTTHVRFHMRTNDGLVHDIIEERTEQMEPYVEHELNPTLRDAEVKRLAAKEGKSIVDWTKMTELQPTSGKPYSIPGEPAAETTSDAEGGEDAETVSSEMKLQAISAVISAHDVRSAETVAMIQYPELQKLAKDTAIEFYCEAISPRLTARDLHGAIEDLANCQTFQELIDKLSAARAQFAEDGPIWDEIEKRLTRVVNRVLNVGFAISWTIDSFSEDAIPLAKLLLDTYGEDVATKYDEIAMHVIDQALCLAGQNAAQELANDSPEVEATEETSNHVIAFANRCSVTKVPYDFADLNVSFEGTAIVTQSLLPELHKLIAAVFERTQDFPVTFSDRYIKTADGVWLSLDMALLNEGSYLITRQNF